MRPEGGDASLAETAATLNSMGVLYDRHETDEHTIIQFSRYLIGLGSVVVVYVILTWVVRIFLLSLSVTLILIVAISYELRPINAELRAAQEVGILTRSGRRMSLRNPLTYYIKKQPQRRTGKSKHKR